MDNKRREEFLGSIKVDVQKEYQRIIKEQKIMKAIDDNPDLLNTLPLEKLHIVEEIFARNYKKLKRQ